MRDLTSIWPSDASQRYPKLVLAIWGLLFLGMIAGGKNLTVSFDTRIFYSEQNQLLLQLRGFERKFSHNNNILFVISPRDGDEGRIATVETLQALVEITDLAWRLPHSTQVESLSNFPRIVSDEDAFSVLEMVPSSGRLTPSAVAVIEEESLGDRLIVDRLLSADGRTTGVNVNFRLPPSASSEVQEITEAAHQFVRKIETDYPHLQVHLTGNVMLMTTFNEASHVDARLLVPVALIVAAIIVAVFLRSRNGTIAVLSILGVASLASMGVAGWFGHVITPASIAAPIIVISIALASTIHVVIAVKHELASGVDNGTAIKQAIRTNAAAVGLTNLTTAVGFLAMNRADAPPLNDMGNIVFAGIVLSYLLTFTWLPSVLTLLPLKPSQDRSAQLMAGVGRTINRLRWVLLIMVSTGVLATIGGLGQIRLDDDFVRYFDDRFEYRVASDFAEERLTGLNIMEFDLETGIDGGVYTAEYQHFLADFTDWLGQQPGVASIADISEITRRIHKAMRVEDEPTLNGIPDNADLISQYFLLYELSLPYGASLTDRINVSRSASRVTIIMRGLTSGEIRNLHERATAWLATHAPGQAATTGISINVLFAYLSNDNIRSMITGTFVSILIIGLIIAFALRSFAFGALSLATNLLPAIVGFGLWGYFIQDIGIAGAVITTMTLGIVVDDTIHFLMKYRRQRAGGASAAEAIEAVFSTVGVAMVITSVSLATGFIVLSLSGFQINRSLGIQTSIIVVVALGICWFLLPPLLRLIDKGGSEIADVARE
ncbi:MMPL family transporter [Parvibaculaceae bacterium PLY_AMNH_Bact1]|nr:MMPL family transporter [Parvibaculaceae bacterium PLY_AMNH_Bact1]